MKKLIAVCALTALASVAPQAASMTGYVSDTKCATSAAGKSAASEWIKPAVFEQCVKDCVKEGSEVVFVTEDNKIVKFDAAAKEKIKPFLGHKVNISGTVKNGVLTIDQISSVKM